MPSEPIKGAARQTSEKLTLEAEAQQVLDELWAEKEIPFQLKVGKLTKDIGEYTLNFYDSRMRSAVVALTKGQSFREMVRAGVLARVAQMSGPLKAWTKPRKP
jgi:hypothetical protein